MFQTVFQYYDYHQLSDPHISKVEALLWRRENIQISAKHMQDGGGR